MSNERKNVEVFVGLFLVIGLSVIASMVVTFGRVGQGFQKKYEITVQFPNAGGLVKDSEVLLSGTRIGFVAERPKLLGSYAAEVILSINADTLIPKQSTFVVGSSGLMGDHYVDVIPQANFDPKVVAKPGDHLMGSRSAGLDDLTGKGVEVMDRLNAVLVDIQKMSASINSGVLNETNLKNLQETFTNLKCASDQFNEATKKLAPILADAQVAVESAKGTMKTADDAAGDLRLAIQDIRKTADSATKTIDSAKGLIESGNGLLKSAAKGNGPLGMLISDAQAADNLKVFFANLRRSGPLFYKDRPLVAEPAPAPAKPKGR